jgi:hypothetical protein
MQDFTHVTACADFALRLKEQLEYVNQHSFNNFKIRVGEFSNTFRHCLKINV